MQHGPCCSLHFWLASIKSEKCRQCNKKVNNKDKIVQEGWNIFHRKCHNQYQKQNLGMSCFKCGKRMLEWVVFQANGPASSRTHSVSLTLDIDSLL